MSARNEGSDFSYPGADAFDPNAAFEAMRADMPERDRRILQRLDVLESVYVECGRDKVLQDAFGMFMRKMLTLKRERRKHANVFFVTGPSGAGKTEAVERLLRSHPALQPVQTSYGTVRRYVSISLTGYAIPRIVAQNIMAAAGPSPGKKGQGDAWNQLSTVLMKRGVSLVHIDETQHIVKDSPMPSRGSRTPRHGRSRSSFPGCRGFSSFRSTTSSSSGGIAGSSSRTWTWIGSGCSWSASCGS